MGVEDDTPSNVNVAIAEFFSLQGDTFNEKRKSFQAFLKKLSLSTEEMKEFGDHLLANKPCVLGVDIFLHFKLYQHVLEVIKSNNGPLVGRILKDWTFFKNIFALLTPDELVSAVLPLLSYTIRMKIINRICTTLSDEITADHLFGLLEDKFGITAAIVVIPACSLSLIKSNVVKYDLQLSVSQLWTIYKKDTKFVEFYFDHFIDTVKVENSFIHAYTQTFKRIMSTNLPLFWSLVDKYKIPIKIGKYSSKKLLKDRDVLLKYAVTEDSTVTFPKRLIYRASEHLGVQKEYLLTFYPDNSDDFLNKKLKTVPTLQKYVPRNQRFALTNSLFKEKYADELWNYPKHLKNAQLLELLTVSERESIVDKFEDKEDFIYFYSAEKSIPIFKAKLQSASDSKTRSKLIGFWFKTCKVNQSKDGLLDLLNVLYNRYRNDTQLLSQFLNSELTDWKKFDTLENDHWNMINRLINYQNQSQHSALWYCSKQTYITEYFKYLVKNNEPIDEFLGTITNEVLETTYVPSYLLYTPAEYGKIFYEMFGKTLKRHKDHSKYKSVCVNFLDAAIQFDKINPNMINFEEYLYILDFCDNEDSYYDQIFLAVLNKFGFIHKNIEKYYNKYSNFSDGFFNYCVRKSPRDLLMISDVYEKISGDNIRRNIYDLFNCPFLKNSFNKFKESALAQLNSDDKHVNRSFSMKFLCLLDEKEFLNFAARFDPPEDGKMPDDLDPTHAAIQKHIINCIPLISYPQNFAMLLKYSKGDYLKFALPSLYKVLFNCANDHVEDFLRTLYKSAVSARKHSLCLGRHLLTQKLFTQFMELVNNQEKNSSIRFIFLKKSVEYFRETRDGKFYEFFTQNLNKIDDKDRSIFDYLADYSKVPRTHLLDYIKQVCEKISVNSDKEIKIKKFTILNSLPDHVFENLGADFITWSFEEDFFEIVQFAIKCLFYSKSDNQQLIFNKFKTYFSGDIKSKKSRENITAFVQKFCDNALEKKAVETFTSFYSNCQHIFPKHGFVNDMFLMEFCKIWFGSHGDVKHFAIKVNKYLIDCVRLYTHSIISSFTEALKDFLSKAKIDEFDFAESFFYTNSLDETYIATIYLLPRELPNVKNASRKYVPLIDALCKIKTPVVMAHLDLYYNNAY